MCFEGLCKLGKGSKWEYLLAGNKVHEIVLFWVENTLVTHFCKRKWGDARICTRVQRSFSIFCNLGFKEPAQPTGEGKEGWIVLVLNRTHVWAPLYSKKIIPNQNWLRYPCSLSSTFRQQSGTAAEGPKTGHKGNCGGVSLLRHDCTGVYLQSKGFTGGSGWWHSEKTYVPLRRHVVEKWCFCSWLATFFNIEWSCSVSLFWDPWY